MEIRKVQGFCKNPNKERLSLLSPETLALFVAGAKFCLLKERGNLSLAKAILELVDEPLDTEVRYCNHGLVLDSGDCFRCAAIQEGEARQRVRDEQDWAYEESLRIDQQRELQKEKDALVEVEAEALRAQTGEERRKFIAAMYERRFQG